jgi:hypothetical protein
MNAIETKAQVGWGIYYDKGLDADMIIGVVFQSFCWVLCCSASLNGAGDGHAGCF